ncbi:MAG: lysostaphin resistance A-like protein [Promethearchaeota archaeon]
MDEIIEKRLHFALSILFLAIINYVFRLIFNGMLGIFTMNESIKIIISYIAYALLIILTAIIIFYIFNKSFLRLEEEKSTSEKQSLIIEEKDDPSLKVLFQGFTFKNFGSQLKSALILICIVYIPLDFFSYVIPLIFKLDVFGYQVDALTSNFLGNYLLYDINLMIIMTIFIHFFIALREEFVFRGFYIYMGENKLNKSTAFFYSAVLFGLAHFSYIFTTFETGGSFFYPFWWGFMALIIGITSAYFYISKKQLWPLIIAHWVNNVLSAIILRRDMDGGSFWQESFLIIYVPIFALGIVLFVVYRKSLIKHVKQIYNFFRDYIMETSPKYFAVDFGLIIVLWLMSLF